MLMNTSKLGTFFTVPIDRKINFYSVGEGDFVVANHSPEKPYLATMGLFTCKAIAIYSHESQRGLLAHLAQSRLLDLDIERLVRQFGDKFSEASVQIVKTQQANDDIVWPASEAVASELLKYGPSDISIDNNVDNRQIRGVALDLADGVLYELDHDRADEWHGSVDFSKNVSIDPLSSFR